MDKVLHLSAKLLQSSCFKMFGIPENVSPNKTWEKSYPLWYQIATIRWKVVHPFYTAASVCGHHEQQPHDYSVGSDIHNLLILQEQSGRTVFLGYSLLFFRLSNQRLSESYPSLNMLLWDIVVLLSMTEFLKVDPKIMSGKKYKWYVKILRGCSQGKTSYKI